MKDSQKTKKIFMWCKVNELIGSGRSYSYISRELGITRKTVRRMSIQSLEEYTASITRARRACVLADCEFFIKGLLDKCDSLSSASIEDKIKEVYPKHQGVSYKTFYNFVNRVRSKYSIVDSSKKEVRQMSKWADTPYGEWGQVDFGQFRMDTDGGPRIKVYFFTMILSRSRQKFIYFQTMPFTSKSAIYAHHLAFDYYQGVPEKILYDQDRVFTVGENYGDIVLTAEFERYCSQESMTAVFARKADPQTKGKVERLVRYVKENFLACRTFYSQEQLNKQAQDWLSRTANAKLHSSTHLVPEQEWQIEKEYLLGKRVTISEQVIDYKKYHVRKDNTISYRGNYYSLPIGTYQGEDTIVHITTDGHNLLINTDQGKHLASHTLGIGKGEYVYSQMHNRKESESLDSITHNVITLLGGTEQARLYVELLKKDKPRYARDNFRLLEKKLPLIPQDVIIKTLGQCLDDNILNASSFRDIASYHMREEVAKTQLLNLPEIKKSSPLKALEKPTISDLNIYENILSWKN